MRYIDMHCDTLLKCITDKTDQNMMDFSEAQTDFRRLKKAKAVLQFFALFFPPRYVWERYHLENVPADEELLAQAVSVLNASLNDYKDDVALAGSEEDLQVNEAEGKLSVTLTIEDGRIISGKPERIEALHRLGVRGIVLTWNEENCLGFSHSFDTEKSGRGLTKFGLEAVEIMQDLGMLVDVSHLSDGGIRDVLDIFHKPIIASHSNCRSLAAHSRNLTDDMIRRIAQKGGAVGLNFYPPFLEYPERDASRVGMDAIAMHAKHMANIGGIDVVAFGGDFDGFTGPSPLNDCLEMPKLADCLRAAGFSHSELEKICHQNVRRVMREAMNGSLREVKSIKIPELLQ